LSKEIIAVEEDMRIPTVVANLIDFPNPGYVRTFKLELEIHVERSAAVPTLNIEV
jgi:hypothetical protein